MALDTFTVLVTTLVSSTLFGAANSIFGWLKGQEPFDSRKFAVTVITGIIAGIGLVFANISGILEAQTNTDLLIQLLGLALLIFGVNEVRTFISGAVVNRVLEALGIKPTQEPVVEEDKDETQ